MPRQVTVSGKILHVFAHRFVVQAGASVWLADVTPKGIEKVSLAVGDEVTLEGEMKPSELKVERLTRGGRTVEIGHGPPHGGPHHHHHEPADPAIAVKAARAAGYEPIGDPRRKPRHFELLARRDGEAVELHIELDGHIRKIKRH